MRIRGAVLSVVVCGVLGLVLIVPAGGASPGVAGVAHRAGHHRRAAKAKVKPAVWTLSEYSKGKLHKLKVGAPYYGLVYSAVLDLRTKEELHGFKWTLDRPLSCPVGGARGTVVSNGVAVPEIEIESISGGIEGDCPELRTSHQVESIETYPDWATNFVSIHFLPARLTLEGGESQTNGHLSPHGAFEIEVRSYRGDTCKYFSLARMSASPKPGEPDEAQQLSFNVSGQLSLETFTSACPQEGTLSFRMISHVGEYGPAMFAEYK
ncbi:MAG TPA: hypothetical protein VHW67_05670 [Solirubrobacteraceae bacterium]|jgi:hypothetical protein|nr:hypothetical protein [Solirubrobacteraceae bacterium]